MKYLLKQTVFWLCLLSGLGLLFIGVRFFLDPMGAENDFGIHIATGGDFSFQYIKGVRDFFFGLIILALMWKKEWESLGLVLVLGTIIPAVDFSVVLSHTDFKTAHLYPHLTAVFICLLCGFYYIYNPKKINP